MRVLILGVTGMLGNAVFRVLSKDSSHEVYGTLRRPDDAKYFKNASRIALISGVDVLDRDTIVRLLNRIQPEVVVNCTGIIKQLEAAADPLIILPANAMFPHQLAGLCALAGARLIALSSDCVFSGRRGNYLESDPTDAEDLYGKSKSMGEVLSHAHAITLRTSGIGHELNSKNGLLEWFLSQGGRVKGFARAIYSGIPSVELAQTIRDYVLPHPELTGLYHLSAKPISKFDLLSLIAKVYGKKIEIERDDTVVVDRSLNSRRFTEATGYVAPDWPALVALMYAQQ